MFEKGEFSGLLWNFYEFQETFRNPRKILGNPRKFLKILENPRKFYKIL